MDASDGTAMDRQRQAPAVEGRSLLDWLRVLRDGWPALVLLVILGLGAGLIATALQSTKYQSKATIVAGSSKGFLDPSSAQGLAPVAATVTRLAGSAAVLQGAGVRYAAASPNPAVRAQRASRATLKWLGKNLRATQVADSGIVTIAGTGPTQSDARALTRAAVRSLERSIGTGPGSNAPAGPGRRQTTAPAGGLIVRDFSTTDQGKVSPTPARNLLLGGNVGLVLGIVAGLSLGAARRRVRRPDEIATELGIPVLGSLRVGRLGSGLDPGLSAARARLQRLGQRDQGTIFLLTGTVRPERTAELGEALARAFAASSRTVLVDADLASRSASRRLQLEGVPGLGELLDGQVTTGPEMFRAENISVTTVNGADGGATIEVLPAGHAPSDAAAALGGTGLVKSLQQLRLRYDFVLVVGPGLDRPAEVIPLISAADWSVLITPRGERARTIESAHGLTDALAGRVAGALLVNRR